MALLLILISMVKSGVELNLMFRSHRDALLRVQVEIRNILLRNENEQTEDFMIIKSEL